MKNTITRNSSIDAAKAIGIFLVCLGHICTAKSSDNIVNFLNCFCYAFHIPLFFYISGILFKNELPDFKTFIKKKSKALLAPYFIYGILSVIIYMVINKSFSLKTFFNNVLLLFYESGIINFNIALWFLPCLFISSIAVYFIIKYVKNINVFWALSLIACILLDYFASIPLLPFNIHSLPYSIFFMITGYCSKDYLNKLQKLKSPYKIIISSLLYIITFSIAYFNSRCSLNTNTYNNIWLYFIGAISGITATLVLADLLSACKPICRIGKNSLGIMVIHSPLLLLASKIPAKLSSVFGINEISLNSSVLIAVPASIILMLTSYLLYFTAKKLITRIKP